MKIVFTLFCICCLWQAASAQQLAVNHQPDSSSASKSVVAFSAGIDAVQSYQAKLSALCPAYAKLITSNKGDKDFDYKINGKLYTAGRGKCTLILYNLNADDILSVKLDDDMGICQDHSATVLIKTKNNN
jgi:hypothetical protein